MNKPQIKRPHTIGVIDWLRAFRKGESRDLLQAFSLMSVKVICCKLKKDGYKFTVLFDKDRNIHVVTRKLDPEVTNEI